MVEVVRQTMPEDLSHGTESFFMLSILAEGLIPGGLDSVEGGVRKRESVSGPIDYFLGRAS